MNNWYDKIPKDTNVIKRDKHFKEHLIDPCSMILCIGGSGSGKSNSLVDYLSKKNDSFCDILIYSGSTTNEPLYDYLQKKIPEIQFFNDIEEFPEVTSFEQDKENEKLIVFDDFINLKEKEMKKIKEYFTAGRKFGCTVWAMAQNYKEVPKTITRNINYFIIFKLNDNITLDNILRNHNVFGIDKEVCKRLYQVSTRDKLNFFLIDLKNREYHLRHNWTKILLKG